MTMRKRIVALAVVLVCVAARGGVVVNEVCYSNSSVPDETGDTSSDWIELYNSGPSAVDLGGYRLGDQSPFVDSGHGVVLPSYTLPAGGYLVVFAGGDSDRTVWTNAPNGALIASNSTWRYYVSGTALAALWKTNTFSDAGWPVGMSPLGYNDNSADMDCATVLGYGGAPSSRNVTTYFRNSFRVLNPATVTGLVVNARINDGAVVYLNGREVWRYKSDFSGNVHLWNSSGTKLQKFEPPSGTILPSENQTYGACPDGSTTAFKVYDSPTPGAANSAAPSELLTGEKPSFSQAPGIYAANQNVALTRATSGCKIRYSVDGSDPRYSPLYVYSGSSVTVSNVPSASSGLAWIRTNPIEITDGVPTAGWCAPLESVRRALVLRAVTVSADGLYCSPETRGTYFVGSAFTNRTLPLVALNTDSDNLFGFVSGLYVPGKCYADSAEGYGSNKWGKPHANYHQDNVDEAWEKASYFEMFEPSQTTASVAQVLGTAMYGGGSRALPQKTLYMIARTEEYGGDRVFHALFPSESPTSYKRFLLRNSGNDWYGPDNAGVATMMKDAAFQQIIRRLNISTMAYRPTVAYVNGEYWGIHNLRESYDKHYLATRYGIDADNYQTAVAQVDVTNYIDYIAAETFFANTLIDFAVARYDVSWTHLNAFFSLGGTGALLVSNVNASGIGGHFAVNDIDIEAATDGVANRASWSGTFFQNYAVSVQAVPDSGYVFDGWVGSTETSASRSIYVGNSTTRLVARFRLASASAHVASGYELWQVQNYSEQEILDGVTAATASSSGCAGLSNFELYAFGMSRTDGLTDAQRLARASLSINAYTSGLWVGYARRNADSADVQYTLVVFAVVAAGQGLVAPLEPMRAHVARMVQAGGHESLVARGTVRLVFGRDETRMEQAAVERAEMELAVDHRLVVAALRQILGDAVAVCVDAHDVAVFRGGSVDRRRARGDAATEIELVGRGGFESVANDAEILFGDLRVEGFEIRAASLLVRLVGAGEEGVPRAEGGAPCGVQRAGCRVLFFEPGAEGLFRGLRGGRLRGGDGERAVVVAPRNFVVHEIADAPRIVGGADRPLIEGALADPFGERGCEGKPRMPTSSSSLSNIHGETRRLVAMTPSSSGLSMTLPPGECPFCGRFLTLRLTVIGFAAALRTMTRSGP